MAGTQFMKLGNALKPWMAQLYLPGGPPTYAGGFKSLGRFATAEEAARAHDR